MTTLFVSHSSEDDSFVRELRTLLADHQHEVWIDSRELRGGDLLWPQIQQAIEAATAFTVVLTPDALQSKWVGKELKHALDVQKQRGKEQFRVFMLSLDGTQLGVLEQFFDDEPLYLAASSQAGGVEAAMHEVLVALGLRLPTEFEPTAQPQAEPLEELVLKLTDFKFQEHDGVRRASASAQLVYEPAKAGMRETISIQRWRLVAPIGPIEANELRWYLEKYAVWPSRYFDARRQQVEADLVQWGQLLHAAALPVASVSNVMQAWAKIDSQAERRFSVYVDSTLEVGASDADIATAREAATLLLGLPWELLHDGEGFLFQGAQPTRVRRRLPNTKSLDVPVVATPIRVLLVTARPEDDACGYIDHRVSAKPLVAAMESLPGLVELTVLGTPTLGALSEELARARSAGQPYHVVHFDGHGVYDKHVGLGGLCFEHPEDQGLLERRRHVTVYTDKLGPLLRDHLIPLVCLEACQSGQAEQASESVASELLKVGVASVVAMTHSVLVETARRFVEVFYRALAAGQRVGTAMLAGQRELKDNTFRGQVFGEGALHLEDWFVPVLFQEKDDPQLFKVMPSKQTVEDARTRLAIRLGELPAEPSTGFIGHSRELLALQRLLHAPLANRYVVIRGQGGEGKTTLAAEFARWMVRSQQVDRAVFVSVETHSNRAAVLDAIGRQIVGPQFSVAAQDEEQSLLQVERALTERATLLVIDNMESILLPPFLRDETSDALTEDARRELDGILSLCARLVEQGKTRLIFTSREWLPAPFDAPRNRRELQRLDRDDAVKLVERVLDEAQPTWSTIPSCSNSSGAEQIQDGNLGNVPHVGALPTSHSQQSAASRLWDARHEEIEQLVDAVHGHARTLALLAPSLRERGVAATQASLVELLTEMHRRFPDSRESSVFASVELSLRRMSPINQQRARVLRFFHGGVDLDMLRHMTEWNNSDIEALASDLIATGLATPDRFNHLTLNPALCPYLRQADAGAVEAAAANADNPPSSPSGTTADLSEHGWIEAMRGYVEFLVQQRNQNAGVASTLTLLELPNLFALLNLVQRTGNAEATIGLATSLFRLLQSLGKPRLLERVGQVRDRAAAALGETWSHARFEAARTRVEQQLAGGQLREAFAGAQQLWQQAQAAGESAYPDADYDLAMAFKVLADVLTHASRSAQALPLLVQARQRFEAVEQREPGRGAARMASVCWTEQGDCFLRLGQLGEAATAYETAIALAEKSDAVRDIAVGKGNLGTVRLLQRRYADALAAHADARERFTKLDEPANVAKSWHQTGIVYQEAGQPEAAEDAYRRSLAIKVRLGNVAGQASTLGQLGNLYDGVLNRPEEAIAFYRQAADKHVEIEDIAVEGRDRSNLAKTLRKLRRWDEARQEIERAIECNSQFGHASEPWTSWAILAGIESDVGNSAAAADARQKAVDCYLAYRRDGGENHSDSGRFAFAVTQSLLSGDVTSAGALLQQLAADPETPDFAFLFIQALQAIVSGSRDRSLADNPALYYTMAAEVLYLIEQLEQPA